MKYASFERLVLVLGGASVLATVAFTYRGELFVYEVIAQLLLFAVLFSAVHWGRRGGFVAAIAASIAYIAMRIPLLPAEAGPTTETVIVILTRVLAYGIIGIVGGELATRMKYVLAGLETSSSIDPWSGIYNQSAFAQLLENAQARFERYAEPFSVVLVSLASESDDSPKQSKRRALVRSAASAIRNDIRLIDEAGRLEDGRFSVLLPHTAKSGGDVVAERLENGVRALLGGRVTAVSARCLSPTEDSSAVVALLEQIRAAG